MCGPSTLCYSLFDELKDEGTHLACHTPKPHWSTGACILKGWHKGLDGNANKLQGQLFLWPLFTGNHHGSVVPLFPKHRMVPWKYMSYPLAFHVTAPVNNGGKDWEVRGGILSACDRIWVRDQHTHGGLLLHTFCVPDSTSASLHLTRALSGGC